MASTRSHWPIAAASLRGIASSRQDAGGVAVAHPFADARRDGRVVLFGDGLLLERQEEHGAAAAGRFEEAIESARDLSLPSARARRRRPSGASATPRSGRLSGSGGSGSAAASVRGSNAKAGSAVTSMRSDGTPRAASSSAGLLVAHRDARCRVADGLRELPSGRRLERPDAGGVDHERLCGAAPRGRPARRSRRGPSAGR